MKPIFPKKLRAGDTIAVIAPSQSMNLIAQENQERANQRLQDFGLHLTFGKHVKESDIFDSSAITSRVTDLHEAFANPDVKGILTVIGGHNVNQLLRHIDWEIIGSNPKIFCGFSDITALTNAMYAKTGLVTYSGPHYSSFGKPLDVAYEIDYFKKCLFAESPFSVFASDTWDDYSWWRREGKRNTQINQGFRIHHSGEAEGTIIGANLCTLNLLQGTEYMPDLTDAILFIEDDEESKPVLFDRDLQSLIHQPHFDCVRGIVIGRFQIASNMTPKLLDRILETKKELRNLPIISNADFGHTYPKITFPIGGTARISAKNGKAEITISKH